MWSRNGRDMRTTIVAVVAALATTTSGSAALGAGPSPRSGPTWVGAWEASPVTSSDRGVVGLGFYNAAGHPPTQDAQRYPTPVLHDQSFRDVIAPHLGGSAARVRLSNRFGTVAATFDAVYLGRQQLGAALVPGSNVPVTFSGRTSVSVPPGADVLSDPVGVAVQPFEHLAISFHTDAAAVDRHDTAQQISYFTLPAAGVHSADTSGAAFTQTTSSWYGVTGLDVLTSRRSGAVVVLGDSITDGFDSTFDRDRRWPDVLARRLLRASTAPLSVLNAGISANAASTDVAGTFGPSAVDRFPSDVLRQTHVCTLVVLEGSNDLVLGQSAPAILAALRTIADRAHSAGLRVVMATIMPRGLSGAQEQARNDVNAALRRHAIGDALLDFDALMRDPSDPTALNPSYDAGDGTHPNDGGYAVMADAVDLSALQPSRSR